VRSIRLQAAFLLTLVALLLTPTVTAGAVIRPPELHPPTPAAEYRRPPDVTAKSWIVFDATDGVVLASRNADEVRPMASTTKMMTALVAIEQSQPDQVVTVSQRAADIGEAEIGLTVGEQFPISELIDTMIIRSANDAAIAVAETIGGDVDAFVGLMNLRAVELGLTRTTFVNPHGLDAEGHASTARDLLRLGLAAMANPTYRAAASRREVALPPAPDGTPRVAAATNELLETYEGAVGVKTGFTFQAGLVLVAAAERDGRAIYVVVMGSEGPGAHFSDATALLDYGFGGHELVRAVSGQTISDGGALRRTAALESRFHIAALLSLGTDADTVPVTMAASQTALPGIGDALGWLFGGAGDG
jgi:D-alanyl-D-alanine carboxypeptidase (penicillin-binding protein 5/6)